MLTHQIIKVRDLGGTGARLTTPRPPRRFSMSPDRSHVKDEYSVGDLQPGGSSAVCGRPPTETTWRTILSLPGLLCVAKICGQKCALLRRISCGFPTGPHVHRTVHHLLCCQPIPQCDDNSCICTLLDCISRVGQQVLKKTAHWDFSWAHCQTFSWTYSDSRLQPKIR